MSKLVESVGVVSRYEKLGRIGEGTYGIVYKGRDKETGQIVALKRIRDQENDNEGIPITSIREIQILKKMNHPNIVTLHDIVVGTDNSIFLVFEFVEHDLATLIDQKAPFIESEVKQLLIQLLKAVEYMHANWVIHRDLKLPNLLFSNSGLLKVADFGLARYFGNPTKPLTPRVVTLWYRPPELLFGSKTYSTGLDMWAVGCIMGELLIQAPLLPGKNDLDQVHRICNLLGSPTDRIWPGFQDLPNFKSIQLPFQPYNNLSQKFKTLSENGLDLLNRFLSYDPDKRISATEALSHPYFSEFPLPASQELMPTFKESQVPK